MAVVSVESNYNAEAISDKQAYGLMQMTQDAADEATITCHLPLIFIESLLNPETNIQYGSCYLTQMLHETDGDFDQALILYNAGYKALTRYLRGDKIPNETSQYVLDVEHALQLCQ